MAFNNYLEDENDKPYFTVNSLAHYYEVMEANAKTIKDMATRIVGFDQQLLQRLREWDGKLESFPIEITSLLKEWVDDGNINHIIDDTLLEKKANVSDVYLKNYKYELENLAPTVLAAIEGGENATFNLLSIPQDYTVTPIKTDFLEQVNLKRVNHFNKDAVIPGGYYDNTGLYKDSTSVSSSGFFMIKPGDTLRLKSLIQGNTHVTYSDDSNEFITGQTKVLYVNQVQEFIVPNDARITKAKVAVRNSEIDTYMITINTPYPETYYTYDDVDYDIGLKPKMVKAIETYTVKKSKLNGLKLGIVGDSISKDGYKGGEYPGKIATRHNMTLQNLAIPGSLITKSNKSGHTNTHMCQKVLELDTDCNLVIVAGTTNDVRLNVPIGLFTDTGIETYYGALHELCKNLIERFPNTPKAFFTPPKMRGMNSSLKKYVDVFKEMAAYYGIPVLDIFTEGDLQPDIDSINNLYYAAGDGIHLNSLGHDVQLPKRESFLESLLLTKI